MQAHSDLRLQNDDTQPKMLECRTHSMMEIDQTRHIQRGALQGMLRALVDEMERWRDAFPWASGQDDELTKFWYRKSKQPVLAILAIQQKNPQTHQESIHFIRSCNLEVSLPTGTLCAERNGIGTALSQNPHLKRADILAVGILSLKDENNPLWPCGACEEWLKKISELTYSHG